MIYRNEYCCWNLFCLGKTLPVLCLILLAMTSALGQTGHYWGQQYGTRSTLLGNSVIGGVQDLGAVYYNPSRLALIENPAFLLTAEIYEWATYTINDAFGENTKNSKSEIGSIPGFVAGTFKLKFLPDHQFAFSVLQRYGVDLFIEYTEEVFGDVLEDIPGDEYFRADIVFSTDAKEEWYALSWSYPFSSRFSVGVTTNLSKVNNQKFSLIDLQALAELGDVAIYQFNRRFSYVKYGLIWKLGVSGIEEKYSWGLTLTTPFVGITGDGNYDYNEFYSGIDGGTINRDLYSTSYQENLKVNIRTPISIAAGVTIPIKRNFLHFSTEWFSKVPKYPILTAQEHYSQSNGDTISFQLIDDLKSVVNVGIGVELYLKENLSVYSSFNTDFSAVRDNPLAFSEIESTANNSSISTNLYHFAGGVVMSFKGVDLTLGASFTGGAQNFARPVDFPDGDDDPIFDTDKTANVSWTRWRLIFGFSIPFLKDVTGKLKDVN